MKNPREQNLKIEFVKATPILTKAMRLPLLIILLFTQTDGFLSMFRTGRSRRRARRRSRLKASTRTLLVRTPTMC